LIPESEEVRAERQKRGPLFIEPYFWQNWLDWFERQDTEKLTKYYLAAIVGMAVVSMAARGTWTIVQHLSEKESKRDA